VKTEPDPNGAAVALVKEALALAGGRTRLLAEATGFSPITIRRWRNGTLAPGGPSRRTLEAYVASQRPAPAPPQPADELPPPADPPLRELVDVPAGTDLPGHGRVYTDVRVPQADLRPAPPAPPTPAYEVAQGLAELRTWVDPGRHPGWLRRAADRAKGLASLATWLGTRRRDGAVAADPDLALRRAQGLAEDVSAPIYVRRLWGHAVRLLLRRGATPQRPPDRRRGALRRASEGGA
jgi:hypothetical protein